MKTIIIVDDDPGVRELIRRSVSIVCDHSDAGSFKIVDFSSPLKCLEWLDTLQDKNYLIPSDICLVITDLNMPYIMDGQRLARELFVDYNIKCQKWLITGDTNFGYNYTKEEIHQVFKIIWEKPIDMADFMRVLAESIEKGYIK